jgi:hypothetical protein
VFDGWEISGLLFRHFDLKKLSCDIAVR